MFPFRMNTFVLIDENTTLLSFRELTRIPTIEIQSRMKVGHHEKQFLGMDDPQLRALSSSVEWTRNVVWFLDMNGFEGEVTAFDVTW